MRGGAFAALGAPETCGAQAERRFGPKIANLATLAAAGLPTPPGAAIDARICAAERDRLQRGGALDPAFAEALRAAARDLARRGGGDPETALLVARLSSETPLPNLGETPPAIAAEIPERVEKALNEWSGKRGRRRRAAAGAEDVCALLIQCAAPADRVLRGARLHDPETGDAAASARVETLTASAATESAQAETQGAERIGAESLSAEAEALLRQAEAALEGPLELDFAAPRADGPLAIVAARPLRLSGRAQLRFAVRAAESGALSRDAALLCLAPERMEELLHPSIEPGFARDRIASGVAASPGAAAGRLCLSTEEVQAAAREGEPAILARAETSPEDMHGLAAAAAVMTLRGGLTSHAAVVARGLGVPCVVGASDARIDLGAGALIAADGRRFERGAWLTIDGSSGDAFAGRAATRRPAPTGDFATVMGWADARRRMRVRANADTPTDVATAVRLGVDGVGLCRTEHMFFDPERITAMREMILAETASARRSALDRLLPMQRADFESLFEIMDGARIGDASAPPVTIRLLDPPLHEFLPQDDAGLSALAEALGQPLDIVVKRARALREFNPMLGKRGCRIGVAYPEIYEMQARAIFEAALRTEEKTGRPQQPEIMIPLVSAVSELQLLEERIADVAATVSGERGARVVYGVGIMVETPRAALVAGQLGPLSTFFSFGTNDLTQMTYGLSRDDAGQLMRDYVAREVFEADPFQTLDRDGVGELVRIGVERGRAANPALEIGLCGEHGGAPSTIAFCEDADFDYVSCSPYRAPIARLAAAQAAVRRDRRRGAGA
ncbi:MAG: putative PEP-binding protein [Pseudomonadota bacterium]